VRTRAVILAGGEGSRLGVLTDKRAKPAVPFAGKYRIIDFTLSNCVNSGLFDVMILTQYRPHSLNEHIAAGRPWDLDRSFTGGVKIYQPYRGRLATDWYKGTADAVFQNLSFVERESPDLVLILSGDHIYKMNYAEMIDFHAANGADLTIATLDVTREEATRMGVLRADSDARVTEFVEKPAEPPSTLASMGIYVFGAPLLSRILQEDGKRRDSSHDFGKDVIPRLIQEGLRVFAYPFKGYWVDVGTIEAYWQTQMDLLRTPPPFNLNDRSWIVRTVSEHQPPVRIQESAVVQDSLVTDGCVIAPGARVENSILSPGVFVGPRAVLKESVVLSGAVVEAGAQLRRAIVDKYVVIGHHARVGAMGRAGEPPVLTTLGKNAVIPEHAVVPAGASAAADAKAVEFVPARPSRAPV